MAWIARKENFQRCTNLRIIDELCTCRKCKSLFPDCRSSWASLSMPRFVEGKILHRISSSGKILLSFPDFSCKESSEQSCMLHRVNPSVTSPCIAVVLRKPPTVHNLKMQMDLREKSTAGFWAVGIHGTKGRPCKPFVSGKFTNPNLLI